MSANEVDIKTLKVTDGLYIRPFAGSGTKLLMVDDNGKVVDTSFESYITVSRLQVQNLRVLSDVDLSDAVLTNAKLKNVVIDGLRDITVHGMRYAISIRYNIETHSVIKLTSTHPSVQSR